jgi:hypothetical protein
MIGNSQVQTERTKVTPRIRVKPPKMYPQKLDDLGDDEARIKKMIRFHDFVRKRDLTLPAGFKPIHIPYNFTGITRHRFDLVNEEISMASYHTYKWEMHSTYDHYWKFIYKLLKPRVYTEQIKKYWRIGHPLQVMDDYFTAYFEHLKTEVTRCNSCRRCDYILAVMKIDCLESNSLMYGHPVNYLKWLQYVGSDEWYEIDRTNEKDYYGEPEFVSYGFPSFSSEKQNHSCNMEYFNTYRIHKTLLSRTTEKDLVSPHKKHLSANLKADYFRCLDDMKCVVNVESVTESDVLSGIPSQESIFNSE